MPGPGRDAVVALISSAVAPSAELPGVVSSQDRIRQTVETVSSLRRAGVSSIVLVDTARTLNDIPSEIRALVDHAVTVWTPGGQNKGLNELYLLRGALPDLPDDRPIMKISARYVVDADAPILQSVGRSDVVGKVYLHRRGETFSTRAFLISTRAMFADLVERSLSEMYAAPFRMTGVRSGLRIVKSLAWPSIDAIHYHEPTIAVEIAMLRAIRLSHLTLLRMERLGIAGTIAADGTRIRE